MRHILESPQTLTLTTSQVLSVSPYGPWRTGACRKKFPRFACWLAEELQAEQQARQPAVTAAQRMV